MVAGDGLAVPGATGGSTSPIPVPADGSVDKSYIEVPRERLGETLTVSGFLTTVGLEQLDDIFDREKITMDILVEMNHDDLKEIGITAYGHRHKIIKGIEKLLAAYGELFGLLSNLFINRVHNAVISG